MAGSYLHIIGDTGRFHGVRLLDHLGDAYEALEECYGMIWLLAGGDAAKVEDARLRSKDGIALSPGIEDREDD
jgi:hypothetical protein